MEDVKTEMEDAKIENENEEEENNQISETEYEDDDIVGRVESMLELNSDSQPIKNLENVYRILENDTRFSDALAYNELDHRIYKTKKLPWESEEHELEPFQDRDLIALQRTIQSDYYGMKPSDVEQEHIEVAMEHSYDPVKQILESLEWDGEEHIGTLLPKYLGVDDDTYQRDVMTLMMLALIERTYNPGAKFDCVAILNGAQGLGKSSFCQKFAFGKPEFFTDNVGDVSDKDSLQIVSGKVVIELAELLAKKKTKEKEAMKRFISAPVDTFRAPYARTYQDFPRRCVIFATTNNVEYLDDPTGSRRWLPLACHAERVKDKLAIQRPEAMDDFMAAWAEAMHLYRTAKVHSTLDLVSSSYALAAEARQRAEQHTEEDPVEIKVTDYLEQVAGGDPDTVPRVSSMDVAEGIGYDRVDRFQLKDIINILDNRPDWVRIGKQRIHGSVRMCWEYRPDDSVKDDAGTSPEKTEASLQPKQPLTNTDTEQPTIDQLFDGIEDDLPY